MRYAYPKPFFARCACGEERVGKVYRFKYDEDRYVWEIGCAACHFWLVRSTEAEADAAWDEWKRVVEADRLQVNFWRTIHTHGAAAGVVTHPSQTTMELTVRIEHLMLAIANEEYDRSLPGRWVDKDRDTWQPNDRARSATYYKRRRQFVVNILDLHLDLGESAKYMQLTHRQRIDELHRLLVLRAQRSGNQD